MGLPPQTRTPPALPPHDPRWRDAAWRSRVRRGLQRWFEQHRRDLPWRHNPTPYRVWVSEIMLQQTQVATVIPYYERFLSSFPTVDSLATAEESKLLSLWEGLGYYRRARSMHAAAKRIVTEFGGRFPSRYEDLVALPGIGRYTAGAILSIADGQRLPILEGNTQRVFSRWIALRSPLTDTAATKLLWDVADAMLPRQHPGAFNQAAMELGALICTPQQPGCDACPVSRYCAARATGLETIIPGRTKRVNYESRDEYALLVRRHDRYLLRPLPAGARWAGLWDFPRTTTESFSDVTAAAQHLSLQLGVAIQPGSLLTTIRHAVTKYRISLRVHEAEVLDPNYAPPAPWQYIPTVNMAELPMSVTARKIARLIQS